MDAPPAPEKARELLRERRRRADNMKKKGFVNAERPRSRVEAHRPDLPPHADRAGARQGCARVRLRRPRVSRPAGGHRRRRARSRPRGPGERHRRAGARDDPLLEPVLSPAAGAGRRAAGEALRAVARLFLQQRRRGRRGLSEVCAALLAYERQRRPHRDHRHGRRLSRPDDGCAVDDVGRALSDAVRAAAAECPVRAGERCGAARGGHREDGRDHPRADSGRRRRPAAHAGVRRTR